MFRFTMDSARRARGLAQWFGIYVIFSLIGLVVAGTAHADTVTYTLDNVVLAGCAPGDCNYPAGDEITGTFVWTYNPADFEGGSGEFTSLVIPAPLEYWEPYVQLITQIQANQIELTGSGSFHDVGLDITIVLLQDLSLDMPSAIDLVNSKFECCGNGFRDQLFASGTITPQAAVPLPAALPLLVCGLGIIRLRARRLARLKQRRRLTSLSGGASCVARTEGDI